MGRAAAGRQRRRTGELDEHHPRRRFPDLQGQRRRLRSGTLLRPRSANQVAGEKYERRRDLGPQARRPRLPQGLRRLSGRHGAQGSAHGDPGQDHQGVHTGLALPGSQCHPSDEKACATGPQGLPRCDEDPAQRCATRGESLPSALLSPGFGVTGDPLPAGPAHLAGRIPTGAPHQVEAPDAAPARCLQAAQIRLRSAGGGHHHGDGAGVQRTAARHQHRITHRADHPGRSTDLRYGLVVSQPEDLQPQRPAVHRGRRPIDAGLQGERERPDPARGYQRGGLDRLVHRRRDVVCDAQRTDDPGVHLLLDVRFPAHRRQFLGGRRPDGPRLRTRRHCRTHHADRRGVAACRRPLPAAGIHQPGGRGLRPRLRLRDRPHRGERSGTDVRGEPGERVLLHHHLQRALPSTGRA